MGADLSPTVEAERLASNPYLSKEARLNPKHTSKRVSVTLGRWDELTLQTKERGRDHSILGLHLGRTTASWLPGTVVGNN